MRTSGAFILIASLNLFPAALMGKWSATEWMIVAIVNALIAIAFAVRETK